MNKKGSFCLLKLLTAGLVLWGCFEGEESSQSSDGGEPDSSEDLKAIDKRDAADSRNSRVTTNSRIDSGASGCFQKTVQEEPEWKCSAEQLEAISASGNPYNSIDEQIPQATVDLDQDVSLKVKDCDELARLRRPQLSYQYQASLYDNRLSILQRRCVGETRTYWVDSEGNEDPSCPRRQAFDGGRMMDGSSPYQGSSGTGGTTSAPTNSEDESGANEYSTTNNQVADVDEADFIKNDSGYIYIVSADELHVIDAWPAATTQEIATVTLPGEPKRLFLREDRLVVYSRISTFQRPQNGYLYASDLVGECTYGYDCRFSSDGGHTLMMVFDVSDPSQPTELARYEMSGAFVAARRVDQYVYTVVQDSGLIALPGITLDLDAESPEELEARYTERKNAIDKVVNDVPSNAFIPWLGKQVGGSQTKQELDSCDNALAGAAAKGTSFLSLIALDIESLARPTRTIVAAKPGFVYASTEALYVAMDGTEGSDGWYRGTSETDNSVIHKFSLDGLYTDYIGSRAIRGHVLNQFSMDEYEGILRVATSNGWVPDPNVSSNVTTLREDNSELVRVGELNDLAPTEDIRAVRFDGDRGFVVTFKKTDPLFVIDLSDPAQPGLLGELMIPGFSTYMHRLDTNHLLAIGFDADEQGSFAYFDGIQIQIFDVTNLSDPVLLHKLVIGTRGSGSEALMNHLAFNYFPSRGVLALPLTICEGGDNGVYGDTLTFSGLMVFNVSLEDGISELGRMPFVDVDDAVESGASCGTWWTNSTSVVKRSIFMEEFTYGISDAMLKVAPLSDLGGILQTIDL